MRERAEEAQAAVGRKLEEASASWAALPTPRKREGAAALVEPSQLTQLVRRTAAGSYIDLDFPPLASSIDVVATSTGGDGKGHGGSGGAEEEDEEAAAGQGRSPGGAPPAADDARFMYAWRRPSDFLAGKAACVFLDGMAPNDVQQGALGNCWFMCAVAALAEFPSLVRSLFLDHVGNTGRRIRANPLRAQHASALQARVLHARAARAARFASNA